MRTRTNLAIDAALLAVYIAAANPAVTGISLHEWLGLGFGLIGLVHLQRHRDWVVRTVRGVFGRMAARSKANLVADALLLLTGGGVVVTGLAISRSLLQLLGIASTSGSVWSLMHAISAYGLVAAVALHVVLHWKWIATAWRLHVIAPLDAAFAGRMKPGFTTNAVAWAVPVLLVFALVGIALGATSGATSTGADLYASAASASGSNTFVAYGASDSRSTSSASSGTSSGVLTCPRTGCTASYCHATQGGGR